MALAAGTRLGPYEILGRIGAGGMGEVYRARDTKLDRDVAIKILPDSLAQDAERLIRFEREAKVLASLNHPNIAHIYGVEERALVMELVEGGTLKGPLPVETALHYARQIADALAAAHDKGIIHRDLKPANIMVTSEGVVKVLDFGLAAVGKPSTANASDPESSPTMTMSATQAGAIMGTAAYMSPEQARGKPVDQRTDIWAFGAVLYEMIAGQRLFVGATVADTLAAVLKAEPDWHRVPGNVRQVLRLCLEKDPKDRLHDIADVKLLLETGMNQVPDAPRRAPGSSWIAAAVMAILLAAVSFLHFREKPAEAPVVRFTIAPPDNTSFTEFPALSPDGRRLVFGAQPAGGSRPLWVRSLDATTPQPLAGTEGASLPFWSPDGRSIGFGEGGKLRKINLSGGPAVPLTDAPLFRGASWSPQGVILFTPTRTSALLRIPASGGAPAPATVLDPARKEGSHRWPWFLPDGKHFLYSAVATDGEYVTSDSTIYAGSLDSRERRMVAQTSSNAAYASGYLLFLRGNTLMAQPFDAQRLATTGEAVPIAEQVADEPSSGQGFFAATDNGTLVFRSGVPSLQALAWLDREGKRIAAVGDPGQLIQTVLSPDGKRATVSVYDHAAHNNDLWIYDLVRNLRSRFTFDPANENGGVWSPDGSRVVFNSSRNGHLDLYWKLASGAGAEELLYADERNKNPTSWSPDGKFILYTSGFDPKTGSDIWVLPLAGERKPVPFLKTAFNERDGQFSPDGHWVAYESNESGRGEIYLASFPASGGKSQVSLAGGTLARWRPDGKELFYIAPDQRLMAAAIGLKGGEIVIGAPQPLFGPVLNDGLYPYDVAPGGQRFLAILPNGQAAPSESVTLVVNWPGGLKK
jgi:eukaryotic-like serine/threonine-protein kinase